MFIGQGGIKYQIAKWQGVGIVPQTLIIVGDKGSGRTTLVQYLADEMQARIYKPEELKVDNIRAIADHASKLCSNMIYFFQNADEMTTAAENALLKLAEEPPPLCYIVLTVEHEDNVLPTIRSRGVVLRMGHYLKNELEQFTQNPDILKCAVNIGQVQELEAVGFDELYAFAKKVLDNIGKVSTINSFNIGKALKFKDEDTGYPVQLFFNVLFNILVDRGLSGAEPFYKLYKAINLVSRYGNQFKIKGLNKQALFDTFVLDLREAVA